MKLNSSFIVYLYCIYCIVFVLYLLYIFCVLICLEVDVGKDEEFTINTRGAGGQGKVDVKITSPSRRPIPCKVESGASNEVHTVKYIPPEEGPYKVDISYDGNPVSGSPFTVEGVMPPDPSKVGVTNRRM